jgi:nucleotide-binding universal stress UspA family protein
MAWLPPGLGKRSGALVTVGKVADEVVRVASEQKVDAIVMGTQGRRGVRRLLRRRMAERVMRSLRRQRGLIVSGSHRRGRR